MAYDFVEVQGALRELAARLDHRDINTVPPFDRDEPDYRADRRLVLRGPGGKAAGRTPGRGHPLGGAGLLGHVPALTAPPSHR